MKILITILLVLIGFAGFSQNNPPIVPRSSSAITVEDARWKAGLNMIGVRTHGLTLNGGLDSVATLIYEDSSGHWWYRDTLKTTPFGHIWSELLKAGDATNILLQNQGANLGVINTLNIGSGLNATFLNGVGTVTASKDTIFLISPLYNPLGSLDSMAVYYVDTTGGIRGTDGVLSQSQYTFLYHKQNPLQWQTQGINVGGLGQITTINLGINMTGTLFGNTLNIDVLAPPAFQKAIAWRNDSTLFAGVGAIDTVQLDSGLIGSVSHGTLSIKVQKDTIFGAYKGFPGDSLFWFGGYDTIYSPRFRDSLNFHHVYNPDGSLTFYVAPAGNILVGADQGLQVVNLDTVQLGGSFYKNDTIEAQKHNFLMDTIGLFQLRAINLVSGTGGFITINSGVTIMESTSIPAGGNAVALFETSSSGGNYKAFVEAGTGAIPFFPYIQLQTSDSSNEIQGSHIKFLSDTTVAGDGITISELPYITDTTNERQMVWNNSTGKLSVMSVGTGGGSGTSIVVATAANTANYTITTANFILLSDLTGQTNRNLVLPSSPTSSQVHLWIKCNNPPSSTFNWSFTNGTVKDYGNNTITTVSTLTVFELIYDGTNWDIIN